MALTAYMSITGGSLEEIKGDCPLGGVKKDTIPVYHVDHIVESGVGPDGRRHHPFTVVKAKDCSSPPLFKTCFEQKPCTVTLLYFRIKDTGEEEQYFTVTLKDALITRIREYTPLTFLPENKPFRDMEEVSFTYAGITWRHADGSEYEAACGP